MSYIRGNGVIVSNQRFFEKDKLLLVLSPDLGKIKVLARGAASSKYRLSGLIDVFNVVEFELFSGRSFLLLNHCDLITVFPFIRSDFNRITLATYFLDLILKATHYEQPLQQLYDLLLSAFYRLEAGDALEAVLSYFHYEFLLREGLIPHSMVVDVGCFQSLFENYTHCAIGLPQFI